MKAALNVYKRRGETPLEALTRLQREMPELSGVALTYAGRLDPMAEGVLVVLVGDEAKRKDMYLALRKRYFVDILFGFSTDTYDIAGKLTEVLEKRVQMVPLIQLVTTLKGTWEEPYPPFSSKPVNGKPLFEWAREGRLSEIVMPTHEVTVYESYLRHQEPITGTQLSDYISASLPLLTGDFRQTEIMECWRANLSGKYDHLYDVATIELECSSGTYVRSIAHDLGNALHIPSLALRITRTSVGTYSIDDSIKDPVIDAETKLG